MIILDTSKLGRQRVVSHTPYLPDKDRLIWLTVAGSFHIELSSNCTVCEDTQCLYEVDQR